MFWVGGMLFLTLVIAPFLKSLNDPKKKSEIYQVVGKSFRFWGWVAIIIMLITGPLNLYYLGITPGMLFDPSFYSDPYGRAIGIKLFFVLLILASSLIHDFWLGPKARGSKKFSKIAMILGRSNLITAIIIVIFAVIVRTGGL
jgi:putative copper export protein